MSTTICQWNYAEFLTMPAQFEKRHSLPLACKPVTARNLPLNYAIGTMPCRTVPNARHSLQAIDYKGFFKLCNYAPLKGVMNAAQYGNSSPLITGKGREINRPYSGTKGVRA